MVPYLVTAGVLTEPLSDTEQAILTAAAPLVQERIALLGETPDMLGFLFHPAENLEYQPDALASLPKNAAEILTAATETLRNIPATEWATDRVHSTLTETLIEGLGLKPRVAFGPLRVAVSGRKISPPLFESMEILGQDDTLARLERLLATLVS